MGTGGVVLLTYGTRKFRELIYNEREQSAIVHHDRTVAKIPIQAQVPATVKIIHSVRDPEGEGRTAIAILDQQKVFQ